MVTHRHTADIDLEYSLDADQLDDELVRLVNHVRGVLAGAADLDPSSRRLIADLLQQFLDTHQNIRLLMKQRATSPGALSDAMSLAREQIEKVFVVALLPEDPKTWTLRYLRDDWRRHYERYLLDKDERGGLPRFAAFLNKDAIASIEKERSELGVTANERDLVEFRYRNPGAAAPPHLSASSKAIERFPTPGKIVEEVSEATLKDALRRWQREYGYFSGYSHAGFRKLMPRHIASSGELTTTQKEEAVEKEYDQALMVSYLAAASAAAEAGLRRLPRDGNAPSAVATVDTYAKLEGFWQTLQKMALLGRTMWELRVRHIMPPTPGA